MNKTISLALLWLIAGVTAFAQVKTAEMESNFSLSGKSIKFYKTETAIGAKSSEKIWNLQGIKNDSVAVVRFWLKDPQTGETSDSAEWRNAYVIVKDYKGIKNYTVEDSGFYYLHIITYEDDVYSINMRTSPKKVTASTKSSKKASWEITKQEADELKGNEAYTIYMYNVPGEGSFVFWGFDEYQFRIISDDGIFNYDSGYNRYSGSYSGESITVGLYDESNKLIEKFAMWLDKDNSKGGHILNTRNAGSLGNPVGQKGKVKKIFKHLQGKSGYVRILATRYNRADFDIKIPPVKE